MSIYSELEEIYKDLNICIFAKDKNCKYTYVNENTAKAADLDSATSMVGKSDDDLIWRSQADFYRTGDYEVLNGGTRLNIPESQIRASNLATILVTKQKRLNRHGDIDGVIGYAIDITGFDLKKRNGYLDKINHRFYLGSYFGNEYLTKRQLQVFKGLILGKSSTQIAAELNIKLGTVQGYIKDVVYKLGCSSQYEIPEIAIKHGLAYLID